MKILFTINNSDNYYYYTLCDFTLIHLQEILLPECEFKKSSISIDFNNTLGAYQTSKF